MSRHRAAPAGALGALLELAELVLPRSCGGCGRAGTALCPPCAAALSGPAARTLLADGGADPMPAWWVADFDGPVRELVNAWKDRGRADLTRPLAAALLRAARAAVTGPASGPHQDPGQHGAPLLLVAAPSSRRSARERGRRPAHELARATAASLRRRGVDVRAVPALRQVRAVADQAGLDALGRRANLAGALGVPAGWRPVLAGAAVLVVDDVVTTGSTALAARAALRAAGADVRGVVAVARTPRWSAR